MDCVKLTTHLSQIRDILSSVPLVPSGIKVKSSLPIARWEVWKVQWPLPVTCKSPLGKKNKSEQMFQTGKTKEIVKKKRQRNTSICTMTAEM